MGRSSVAVGVFLLLAACTGKDRLAPGEAIGTFHVVGALRSTTCGTVPDPWEFDVRLRFEDVTLYWVQGDAPISGVVSASRVELKAKGVMTVRNPDAKTQTMGCAMQREDLVDMTVSRADQAPPTTLADTASFRGTLRYRFAPTAESDCMDQLHSEGGDYENLPCEVAYEIAGTKK
jgi:hypothetical protein